MNTKLIHYSIAGILAGTITLLSGTVYAQEVPNLKKEMPYAQARELLINKGWRAIEIPILQRGDQLFGATKYIVKELGYNEVVDCSGTGMGFCRFEFEGTDGRKLIVITVDNQKKQQPIVYRWSIEAHDKAID
ncbi:hypothetical protein ACKFKG_03340 [Phormidesmis sp. 146-35]